MDFKIQYYSLDNIFERCSLKLSKDEGKDRHLIPIQVFQESWQAFVKWSKSQLDLERTLSITNFGNISYKKNENPQDKEKIIQIYINEQFIHQNHYKYRGDIEASNYPPIKINFSAIQKITPDINKMVLKLVIDSIFQECILLLSQNNQNVQVDLGILGKISLFEKTISYESLQFSKKSTVFSNKQTVKNLLDQRRNLGLTSSMTSFKNINNNESQLQQSQLQQSQNQSGRDFYPNVQQPQTTKSMALDNPNFQSFSRKDFIKQNQSQPYLRRPKVQHSYNTSFPGFSQVDKNMSSPTRRFKIENVQIDPELLAAGTDPLAKNQDFSRLANKAASLINATFTKPPYSNIRFPPILDKFSRTLAAPLSAQKHNLSVSARIANNYTPTAKKLYFDNETKGIKVLKLFETAVAFTANNELLREPADLEEELDYVVRGVNTPELNQKMEAKKTFYKRYRAYIEHEISVDFVAPIDHNWITDILELIPHQLQYVDGPTMTKMIDKMLNEINRDYYESVRKSILDYVLKDEDERKRIGLMTTFDQVKDYGENIYCGLEADDAWKEHVELARQEISQNLVICSRASLELMELWKKYEKMHFLVLPSKKDPIMNIGNFLEIQDKNIKEVKNHLVSEWHKDVIEIFKEELTQMNKNKRMAVLFFESNATLMSNQIRQLVTDSLILYKEFFYRFKKEKLYTYSQIIEMEKDCRNTLEDAFLQVQLVPDAENEHITFKNELEQIKDKILNIIDMIVETSKSFPRAENHIARSDKQSLWDIPEDDETYQNVKSEVESILQTNINNIAEVLNVYEEYAYLLQEKKKVAEWVESEARSRSEYDKELKKYKNLYQEVSQNVPFFVRMNMILIDGTEIKRQFLSICTEIEQSLETQIHIYIMKRSVDVSNDINKRLEELKGKAQTTDKLVELEQKKEEIKTKEHKRIKEEFADLQKWLDLLLKTTFKMDDKSYNDIYQTSKLVHGIMAEVESEEARIDKEREQLEQQLKKRRDEFEKNIKDYFQQINGIPNEFKDQLLKDQAVPKMIQYREDFNAFIAEMEGINKEEGQLDWQVTEFPELLESGEKLKPFEQLWFMIRDKDEKITNWTKTQVIFDLNPEEMEKDMKEMEKTANKLVNFQFDKKNPKFATPLKLAQDVKKELQGFKENIILARVFSNKGLKERHWKEIQEITEMEINPNNKEVKWNLNKCIQMELHQKKELLEQLEVISDQAQKEWSIEKILDKMKEDWEPVLVELKEWKDTGTFIVAGASNDEVQTILDDQIVKTLTMKGSPQAKIFEERINEWDDFLNYVQNLFDIWLKVQGVWLYLEPVMTAPDIKMKLKKEGDEFEKVDKVWRNEIIGKVIKEKRILEFTKDRKMLIDLRASNDRLDIVQKGLNSYLEDKRGVFPRFYFLGDSELLEILSETKDPLRVQPFLKKCFEGIEKLLFKKDNVTIEGMYSTEKEYVPFNDDVDTTKACGNVDNWLVWVEEQMIASVKQAHAIALEDFQKMKRNDWVMKRCGMACLCINMTYWTSNTEEALSSEGQGAIKKYLSQLERQLLEIVEKVRSPITPLDRSTIEALIVLDVHNKETVKTLIETKVESTLDFGWTSQLRYYWQNDNVVVKIINAICEYNYEYLGNSSRLVITPLTDRCYRTLCGAVHLNYGGAPEGPAGTGKTETVKDLAKALARQCVVFNCSDGLDYKAMGKFFKGLAQSGAWSCFDEFNRIDLEVLSVVATQISDITEARKKGLVSFVFEGTAIKLKKTANSFITMNPGYAGRSELPDNLKALFRSVAMMVPDYALISEIKLYSFGFQDALNLARKIVTTYKLCSEQLSSQDHYDYGMRAVISVLVAAGNLKKKFPEENESILMLRAINEVNLAKFLAFDLPLFEGITSDLFPGVKLPEQDYVDMFECIQESLDEQNQQKNEYINNKIIQIYEMIRVRHGLMVVGMPFAGKTTGLHTLKNALGRLEKRGKMDENTTQICTINPKSINMKLLYGFADEVSHEWTDGILAVKYRNFARDTSTDRKWLVFDGPVDAVWIENMNTVLDDNKKLCLNSGEIIAMNNKMNIIFEPMDLAAASPATVSRCGMIYMEPGSMGWKPMFVSWRNKHLPKCFKNEDIDEINMLFNWIIDPSIDHLREFHQISPTQTQNLVISLMNILKFLLQDFANDEALYNKLEMKNRQTIIHCRFTFAFMWSVGGALSTKDDRKKFDLFYKRLVACEIPVEEGIETKKISNSLPDRGTVYEYNYQLKDNKIEGEWILWTDQIRPEEIEEIQKSKNPQSLTIPTVDTMRYKFLLSANIQSKIPTLFCGPTGTGKSVYTKNLLYSLPRKDFKVLEIGFSAQTSSQQVQDIFDSNCDRRRKGVYGPKLGEMIIFIDDLNMPTKEVYGAQPPIELVRQIFDQGGYYDIKDPEKPFKQLENVIFCSSMGPPGGGRTFVTPRILRHFNLVSLTQFDDDTLNVIFSTILKVYLTNNGFNADVLKCESKVIQSTNKIYQFAMEELLPTPAKSHYLFNLRDFSKVILGMCMADKEQIDSMEIVIRLWVHECLRVFYDRLINEDDRLKFLDELRVTVRKIFGSNFDNVFEHLIQDGHKELTTLDELRGLMFTDILTPMGAPKKPYEEIRDQEKLQKACDEALDNYNMLGDKPMDLVMFQFAIEHLLIICRILKSPGGNALLVGVGGSGRQSLTTLGASINEFKVIQIEITKTYGTPEWHDDLKIILKTAGGKKIPTVFLFTDSQIKQESFVEDINNLLNTCEVPNLFPPEDKTEVMELVRNDARNEGKAPEGTPEQLYSYFIERCKQNLHIVLAFSPIGDGLRQRVRMFPSLVNCCTIDWFFEWPQDALVSVAKKFLAKVEMETEIRDQCTLMVQYFHESTAQWAEKFFNHLSRKYYVTPTSYLEMIITFQSLLSEKRKQVKDSINKYENGYNQIVLTEGKVSVMQETLVELVPKIKVSAEEAAKKAEIVSVEKEKADEMAAVIQKEEAIVQVDVDSAKEIENEVNTELEKALPALKAAEEALQQITKKDTDYIKSLSNPPEAIKVTMKAICLILFPHPGPEFKEKVGLKTEINWWKVSKQLLNDPKLVQNMKDYKKEEMPEAIVKVLGKYLDDPENEAWLKEEKVTNASPAAWSMLCWASAMRSFYYVNKEVVPKKVALQIAQDKVAVLMAELSVKQKSLKVATDKVKNLNDDLQQTIANKEALELDYETKSVQLERAKQLIESLGGEKGRWQQLAKDLQVDFTNLTGDVLVSSGMIAYLGAFTPSYRNDISTDWAKNSLERNIPGSEKFSINNVLGDPVQIRQWNIEGLPSDNFSIENAIFINKSRRWPLCIDPQGQANKWIKRMENDNKLDVIKLTDSDYIRKLETAIQFGKPVLLENVQEEIDASLTPILLKQTYTKGNTTYLKLGDNTLEYNKQFKFYVTSKLRNPHYLPELSTKVVIINFMITYEGLNDQLLGILVKKERPDLETEKERLIVEGAANKKQLAEIESQILQVLSGEKDILTDESAINILKDAQITSTDIKEKQVIAEETEIKIDTARQKYQPVSQQASSLFFCISDLNNLDPMYQYSLVYYIDLFTTGIQQSEKSEDLEKRLDILKNYFTYSLYANICRSLFEKDKLCFSMLLTCRLLEFYGKLNNSHWRFLLTGGTIIVDNPPQKPEGANWISEKSWKEIIKLSKEQDFNEKDDEFYKTFYDEQNLKQYKEIYDSNDAQSVPLPDKIKDKYSSFHHLMILRTLRPDKLIPGVHNFVVEHMGKKFLEPPPFDLGEIYKDSSPVSPLIFVLSPGSDPFQSLIAYAKIVGKADSIKNISLGQGQGPIAQKMIDTGIQEGHWVVLMNCHLAVSWMTTLEKICENISPDPAKTDPGFRLWLTSYPSPNFPTSVLQAGIKMTNEPPKGLRSNLVGSFYTTPIKEEEFFESCQQPQIFKKLLYGLCFFHAVIQERRKYGPLGWNIPYEFNESDLRICVQQLKMFLDEFVGQDIPFDALKYLTAECNYGGRVTDDKDRRLIVTLLEQYYCPEVQNDENYSFFNNEKPYIIPKASAHGDFIEMIKEQIPAIPQPGVFGFHPNADITKDMNETYQLTDSLLTCSQSSGGGSGGSDYENLLNEVCSKILNEFPQQFDKIEIEKKYPVMYEESMNTVLLQELTRFNRLIAIVRASLADILKAIKGLLIMSPDLEKASQQIYDGKIPEMWLRSSYPSLKPLAGYVKNLQERIKFMQDWIDEGMPKIYWLSGFYFTQSFLTGVLQNFARKYTIPIDEIEFDFVMKEKDPELAAEDGAYINGLFIEGAKFDFNDMQIVESDPKILFVDCPIIKLVPIESKVLAVQLETAKFYKSPVYKTTARRGILSTTGHSTNFVMYLRIPSDMPQSHWIKRGVAMLTQLDD